MRNSHLSRSVYRKKMHTECEAMQIDLQTRKTNIVNQPAPGGSDPDIIDVHANVRSPK